MYSKTSANLRTIKRIKREKEKGNIPNYYYFKSLRANTVEKSVSVSLSIDTIILKPSQRAVA